MTPAELYALEPQERTHTLGHLNGFYFKHVPEVDRLPPEDLGKRIEIRWAKYHNLDYRRYWALGSIWFDGRPFMIIQNAGREGDDHYRRFITDDDTYREAARYLKSIELVTESALDSAIVPLDVDLPGLTEFYGGAL